MVSDKINNKITWFNVSNIEFPSVQRTHPGWAGQDLYERNHSPRSQISKMCQLLRLEEKKKWTLFDLNKWCALFYSILTYRKHRL